MSVCARYSSSGANHPWLANARKLRDGRWTMSGGLFAAKRTVILSAYSRKGTCVFLTFTPGFFASKALISSVQYSPAPGSSACHVGKSSSIVFGCAPTLDTTTSHSNAASQRFPIIVPSNIATSRDSASHEMHELGAGHDAVSGARRDVIVTGLATHRRIHESDVAIEHRVLI